jgi:pimeloyl-ACP methyl ester carboxylesterase
LSDLQTFRLESTGDQPGCAGVVPPEYSESRPWPIVIAFPQEGVSAEKMLTWWTTQAARYGYIVAIPELYEADAGAYDASAESHRRFLQLIRRLKTGLRIDDDRVFVAGHGIGGEAAMDVATSHPDLFAGLISIAGLSRRHIQWTACNDPSLPWYVVVGGRQGYWSDRMSILLEKLFRRTGDTGQIVDMMFVKYPERGFETFTEESPYIFEWMQLFRRNAVPDRLSAKVMRSTDTSWHWLQLQSIPARSVRLDEPTKWSDRRFEDPLVLQAHLARSNAVHVATSTPPFILKLSEKCPGIDLQQPITIVRGRQRKNVNYRPSISDMLEEFRLTGERVRLCGMKVFVD